MEKNRPYFLLFISAIFLSIGTVILLILITQQPQTLISRAEQDPNFCQNHCQDPTCRGKPDFYDEACCLRIQQTGDPSECSWPQRGWCMPEHCATIPEEVNPQRCASPRKGWCDLCKENKCPGFVNIPIPTSVPNPTQLPLPTQKFISPTLYLTPTHKPQPTTIIKAPPNEISPIINMLPTAPQNTPPSQFEFPSIQFLKINTPKTQIDLPKINQLVRKPMNIVEFLFKKILYFDKKLENAVNERLRKILN